MLMIEKGILEGVSMILKGKSWGENYTYIGDYYNSSNPTKYITYLDVNNVYG